MKKTVSLFTALIILSAMLVSPAYAAVTDTYQSVFGSEQGVNNWCFCEFDGNNYKELIWDAAKKRWKTSSGDNYPIFASDQMMPGNEIGVGLLFISPKRGMLQMKGEVCLPYSDGAGGKVIARIMKGKKVLWSETVAGKTVVNYDLTNIPIKEGEELRFVVNCAGTNENDFTRWWPSVEYTDKQYVPEKDGFLYYQCSQDGEEKQLIFNEITGQYIADDDVAYVSSDEIFPTVNYSLIRRYNVTEDGRHRIYASFGASDKRGGGNVVTVFRNKEQIWEQLIPAGEMSAVDVRALCKKGDVLDVKVSANRYTGYNQVEWEGDIYKFNGTIFCDGGTSAGFSNAVLTEYGLDSFVKTSQGSGVEYYSVYCDKKYPMEYDTSATRWKSTVGDGGYISAETARPGKSSDTYIDITLTRDGMIRIAGDLAVSSAGDGVLSKISLNGVVIWSSRVGEERSVRWDEPYDVSYFSNCVNAVAEVRSGDVLSFSFAKWRNDLNDSINIKNVKLSYIEGNPLSETTRWKLNKSIVIDTLNKLISASGNTASADILVLDGTTYVTASETEKLLGGTLPADVYTEIHGMQYVMLRKAAAAMGKNVLWTSDRLIIIYDGIPVLYGYPELDEIDIALRRGELFE